MLDDQLLDRAFDLVHRKHDVLGAESVREPLAHGRRCVILEPLELALANRPVKSANHRRDALLQDGFVHRRVRGAGLSQPGRRAARNVLDSRCAPEWGAPITGGCVRQHCVSRIAPVRCVLSLAPTVRQSEDTQRAQVTGFRRLVRSLASRNNEYCFQVWRSGGRSEAVGEVGSGSRGAGGGGRRRARDVAMASTGELAQTQITDTPDLNEYSPAATDTWFTWNRNATARPRITTTSRASSGALHSRSTRPARSAGAVRIDGTTVVYTQWKPGGHTNLYLFDVLTRTRAGLSRDRQHAAQ